MKIPEQYSNLDIDKKRLIVSNLVIHYGNEKTQELVKKLRDDQIDFLFTYFFTESKETREKMRNEVQRKYESALNELEKIADRLQKLNLQFAELLAERDDIESFGKWNK